MRWWCWMGNLGVREGETARKRIYSSLGKVQFILVSMVVNKFSSPRDRIEQEIGIETLSRAPLADGAMAVADGTLWPDEPILDISAWMRIGWRMTGEILKTAS